MRTESAAKTDSFSVQGKVFDVTTKNGIGNLLVTVYDAGTTTTRAATSALANLLKTSTRIGSVLTATDGQFSFTYNASDILLLGPKRKRLNLMLVVSAPEDEHATDKVLYCSNPPRMNAGRIENFSIGIVHETQEKFRLNTKIGPGEQIEAYKRARTEEAALNQGIVDYHAATIKQDIKDKATLRQKVLKAIATDTSAPLATGELAGHDDMIKDKVLVVGDRTVARANERINDRQGVPVTLYLTPEDRERLKPFLDAATNGVATIPEHQLQDILFRANSTNNPGTLLVNQNPFAKSCAQETPEEKCAEAHASLGDHSHNGESDAPPGPITGAGIETITNADIPKYVANLVSSMTPPDSVLNPGSGGQRADRVQVEDSVDTFSLRKGPAEVPAFYDFHSLQIAFEHVWKILIDEGIVEAAHRLDKKYQQKTGVPLAEGFPRAWPNRLSYTAVYESVRQEVPADIAAQFDITVEEWTDLSASHQSKLKEIARDIAAASDPISVRSGFPGIFVDSYRIPANVEKKRQELREQADRIIEGVRHDDYYTMHKTLRDLNSRVNSNYEFTVFAASRDFHSVNFGLLNTYRQQWTPLNYQAGKLVRTIPLSPKEERKYSLKVTRSLKQARKEALKNNSSLKNEQSSTSRVEAEIMAKVQNKTNFNLSAEGTYNIGLAKGDSTTTFGLEAQRESAETRKDFREAVLKATQEYNEERSIQIDTEESSSEEYNESGTIVNPNDELSVTYLFYELQRRYRVSEQLYRAAPVVLVAQEVPAPHEITESWVISNDWIINRVLLDDSHRPALQYLANKSVGDDFALRELRKNLRQQRNLVETLKIELASAGNEAANRYRALERAIAKRIDEESDEKTDGFLSDVGDFFGGGGQDPEAAKARELAAKDAHQYAVEKAERAAAALRQEVSNLHTFTREYTTALREHLDSETKVKRLLVHIRNNMLYYMQAIWSMEPPDQRFLRLHKVQVPQLDLARVPDPDRPGTTIPDRAYRVEVEALDDIFSDFRLPGTTKHKAFMTGTLEPITEFKPLVEVAELDNLLGFKGNYMIFPMKQHNALTEFMTAPYVDSAFGAMDPDELTNVNLNDYSKYVCCLHEKLPTAEFEAMKPKLKEWLKLLLADQQRNGDEIVVPTNSLFIEALPGTHSLLEDFKLRHRQLDVFKVQAEVRKVELENLRLAARLINDEREDPDVEKKIVVKGGASPLIGVDNP